MIRPHKTTRNNPCITPLITWNSLQTISTPWCLTAISISFHSFSPIKGNIFYVWKGGSCKIYENFMNKMPQVFLQVRLLYVHREINNINKQTQTKTKPRFLWELLEVKVLCDSGLGRLPPPGSSEHIVIVGLVILPQKWYT